MIVLSYGKKRQFTTLTFNSDTTLLAAGGDFDDFIPIWELATGAVAHNVARVIGHTTQSLAFHPRAPWLYIAHSYGLTAFGIETEELRELYGENEFARNVAVDPTGKRLVGSHHPLWKGGPAVQRLTCFNIAKADSPKTEWEVRDAHAPHNAWTELAAFFANGKKYAAAERANGHVFATRIVIRKATDGEVVRTCGGTGTDAQALAVSPLGTSIISRIDRRLYVFDVADPPAAPREIVNDGRKHFTGIAFHPSGRYLAATSNDATVKLYDTTTWEVARNFTWDIGKMRSVAFSPDGTLAAAGSDKGKVVVWDVDL